ncbi:MAG: hypothetical protein PUD64_08445 [Bacteroidales bacterium]|nr:hypothetical protein [Bacteroidales bacterium]
MNKGLKRFGVAALIVFASVAVLDVCTGLVVDAMLPQIDKDSKMGKSVYALYNVSGDYLIVGSSRAANHYDTPMIADSIGIDFDNLGIGGTIFADNYCIINTILDRYTPKVIVWEFSPAYLFMENDNCKVELQPFYKSNRYVHDILSYEFGADERFKMNSNIYRLNSKIQRIVMRYMVRKGEVEDPLMGYEPLTDDHKTYPQEMIAEDTSSMVLNRHRVRLFSETISKAQKQGCRMLMVYSPRYESKSAGDVYGKTFTAICDSLGVPFIDNSQIPEIVSRNNNFHDAIHLNETGARCYMRYFIPQLRSFLNETDSVK